MGSPYHRASRHTVVSLMLHYIWDKTGGALLFCMSWAMYTWMTFYGFNSCYFFLSVLLFIVKVVFLKLIWHFPKTIRSGRLKWNLSQIFGILMVGTNQSIFVHCAVFSFFVVVVVVTCLLRILWNEWIADRKDTGAKSREGSHLLIFLICIYLFIFLQ